MVAVWDVRRLLHRETYLVGRERQSQNEEIDSTMARSKYPIFPTSCRHLLAVDKEAGLGRTPVEPPKGFCWKGAELRWAPRRAKWETFGAKWETLSASWLR